MSTNKIQINDVYRQLLGPDGTLRKDVFYIYSFTNKLNGKKYIGKTKRIERRWQEHVNATLNGNKNKFHNAMRKYGIDYFAFDIVAIAGNEKAINLLEKEYISIFDTIDNGYNTREGGEGLTRKDLAKLWNDPGYLEKQSKAKKKHWENPEYRSRMTAISKEKSNPDFLRGLAKANWLDPERAKRMSQGRKTGKIEVLCLETLQRFSSTTEAMRKTGVPRRCITLNINGETFRAGKMHWIRYRDIAKDEADKIIKSLENNRHEKLLAVWRKRKGE